MNRMYTKLHGNRQEDRSKNEHGRSRIHDASYKQHDNHHTEQNY